MQFLLMEPKRCDLRLKDGINALLITKDLVFAQNYFVTTSDTAITNCNYPVIEVYNTFNTDVEIRKGIRIATGTILKEEQQTILDMCDNDSHAAAENDLTKLTV